MQSSLARHQLLHCTLAGLLLLVGQLAEAAPSGRHAEAARVGSAHPWSAAATSAAATNASLADGTGSIDVIVIGDSTAANYANHANTYPLAGWAMFLQDHLSAAVTVRNVAVPGRSSMSYYLDQLWQQAKTTYLSPGDYVLIQFGHNDQSSDPARHTDPFTTFTYYLSLYINDSRAALATPVPLTPISRALWDGNGVFIKDTFGDYIVAMRQLAQELQVPLIDLNEYTAELFSSLGEEATQNTLFMCLPPGKYPNYPDGLHDTTHLQVEGAKRVAALAAKGITRAHLPLLSSLQSSHAR